MFNRIIDYLMNDYRMTGREAESIDIPISDWITLIAQNPGLRGCVTVIAHVSYGEVRILPR